MEFIVLWCDDGWAAYVMYHKMGRSNSKRVIGGDRRRLMIDSREINKAGGTKTIDPVDQER